MKVSTVLTKIEDMDGVLDRAEENRPDPAWYKVNYNDMIIIRTMFREYKDILLSLEIEED